MQCALSESVTEPSAFHTSSEPLSFAFNVCRVLWSVRHCWDEGKSWFGFPQAFSSENHLSWSSRGCSGA